MADELLASVRRQIDALERAAPPEGHNGRIMSRVPRVDIRALRAGESTALAGALAAQAAAWFRAAGSHIGVPPLSVRVAQAGNTTKAGLLACAADLCALLAESPQGRQALRDLGFEPVLQQVESE